MAETAHKTEEAKREFFDPPEVLEAKVDQLVEWIRESQHFITFTGAGISTSAGIPDYRSGINTVLPTGPGCWEKKATKTKGPKKNFAQSILQAAPTPTHMAMVKLQNEGLLKCVVSQNIDGLHRKSGILPKNLCELHGNTNLETCTRCKKEYMRDFRVRNAGRCHDHLTGRKCENPKCQGTLKDSIINFGENLDDKVINKGFKNGEKADLCLAMGSSLTVTPAANIPEEMTEHGRLVIVNLQATPLDYCAALRINAFCDTVMQMVMQKLELETPVFQLIRRVRVTKTEDKGKTFISGRGVDSNGSPFQLYKQVDMKVGTGATKSIKMDQFKFEVPKTGNLALTLHPQGHYREPVIRLRMNLAELQTKTFLMLHTPGTDSWEIMDA